DSLIGERSLPLVYIRDETYSKALAEIVNYHHRSALGRKHHLFFRRTTIPGRWPRGTSGPGQPCIGLIAASLRVLRRFLKTVGDTGPLERRASAHPFPATRQAKAPKASGRSFRPSPGSPPDWGAAAPRGRRSFGSAAWALSWRRWPGPASPHQNP